MSETYTLGNRAYGAHNPVIAAKPVLLPDSVSITLGAEQRAMRLGLQIACQAADGAIVQHVFDAERWTYLNPYVRKV